ncbi:Imidazoleglycerol-phosphate dehydratase [hydrothermal vent metagenome]|uniref:Imidazoleglycerol-phosphate dehydratase n=1 Tax=hydrothermal vent metagenome TaxID=652676 RepID=A0A3B1DSK9_9ZZZZ
MSERKATLERKSKETQIIAELNIDGKGETKINTPIKLLDHMLELFAFHGFFDLTLDVKGDTEIDIHHTNEDIGIVLGKVFKKALDEKQGIKRFGSGDSPMEATLGSTVVDISGRGYLTLSLEGKVPKIEDQEDYAMKYLNHFMESFAHNLGATINITIKNPDEDLHTNIETVFKSLGQALDQATQVDQRRAGEVPSTKGIID